jgi:hypothetical protein
MKMDERMKLRSVSFSDEAQPPILPARNNRNHGNRRKQNSVESLPLYGSGTSGSVDLIYGPMAGNGGPNRLNSLPRMMPHHRRKILEQNRPSSSLAGTKKVY